MFFSRVILAISRDLRSNGKYRYRGILYVTVHAKTSLVHTKIEIHFFTPAYSYIH